jgi:hypothetical protein
LGIGGGARLGNGNGDFEWRGVFSDWIHWLIKGINDVVDEILFVSWWSFLFVAFERCVGTDFTVISFDDFERLRFESFVFFDEVFGGDVEYVRKSFWSFRFDRRKLSWNDDERIKLVFDALKRSIKGLISMR